MGEYLLPDYGVGFTGGKRNGSQGKTLWKYTDRP